VVVAALAQGDQRLIEEVADSPITPRIAGCARLVPADVMAELEKRHK